MLTPINRFGYQRTFEQDKELTDFLNQNKKGLFEKGFTTINKNNINESCFQYMQVYYDICPNLNLSFTMKERKSNGTAFGINFIDENKDKNVKDFKYHNFYLEDLKEDQQSTLKDICGNFDYNEKDKDNKYIIFLQSCRNLDLDYLRKNFYIDKQHYFYSIYIYEKINYLLNFFIDEYYKDTTIHNSKIDMQPCKYNKFTIGGIISKSKMTPESKKKISNSLIFKDYTLSPKYNNFWLSVYYNLIQLKLSENIIPSNNNNNNIKKSLFFLENGKIMNREGRNKKMIMDINISNKNNEMLIKLAHVNNLKKIVNLLSDIYIDKKIDVDYDKGKLTIKKDTIEITGNDIYKIIDKKYINFIDFTNATKLTKIYLAFVECKGITELDLINTSLTEIGEEAFSKCTGITKLELPNSLIHIGNKAFFKCTGITGELKLPYNLTSIRERAFFECTGIKKLKIPNSLNKISIYAFFGCTGITKLELSNNVIKKIEDNAFYGCINIKLVSMSDDTINIKTELESIKQKLVKITGNNSWNKLGEIKDTKPDNDNCLIIEFKSDSNIKYYVIDLSKNTNATQKGGRRYKTKRLVTCKRYNRNSKKK